jgi:acyl-CoA synthetase (AMP-forming)/AMP-acid ligase II
VPTHYRIVGRCKDIINRGGVKLSPSEIDALLQGAPGVAEAAVCAVADDDLGERVCACVVLQDDGEAPALDTLRAYLEQAGTGALQAA